MNSIQIQYKNGYYIQEFTKRKISDLHRLILDLSDKKIKEE